MANRFQKLRDELTKNGAGRSEAIGQGLFGLGDELGAGMQAGMAALTPGMSAKDTYNQALGENRGILDKEHKDEPVAANALEIAASIPATAALPFGRVAGAAAKNVGLAAKLGGVPLKTGVTAAMKAAAPVGALFGFGKSHDQDAAGVALDTLGGAATAAGTAGLLRAGGNSLAGNPLVQKYFGRVPTNTPPRDYGEMTPDQIRSLGMAQGLQQKFAQARMATGKPLPGHSIIDPDSGRVLMPGDAAQEARNVGSLADLNRKIDAAGPSMAPDPALNSRLEALKEAIKTGRLSSDEQPTLALSDLFGATKRSPNR